MNKTVGEKIRNFRKRAGISQLELEMRIGTSPGSISRIESGEVNPTKETLIKLIDALDLSSLEAMGLFGIEFDISKLLVISKDISNSKNIDEVLSKAVNTVVYELNLVSAFVTLKRGNKLYACSTTKRWFTDIVMKIIPEQFNNLNVDLIKDKRNLCVKCFHNQEYYLTNDLSEITFGTTAYGVTKLLARVTGFKSGIVLPISFKSEKLGTLFVVKNYSDDFKSELPILKEFTNLIGEAIFRNSSNSDYIQNDSIS